MMMMMMTMKPALARVQKTTPALIFVPRDLDI